MVIRFAGAGGHAPMMQVGLVFMGSSGTFEGGFLSLLSERMYYLKRQAFGEH